MTFVNCFTSFEMKNSPEFLLPARGEKSLP